MSTLQRRRFLASAGAIASIGTVSRSPVTADADRSTELRSRWERTIDGGEMGSFADAVRTADGYLLVGTARGGDGAENRECDDSDWTYPTTHGWAVKLSPAGDVRWQRRYRSPAQRAVRKEPAAVGPIPEDGFSLALPADDGHLLVGWTYVDSSATFAGYLVRVDAAGDRLWELSLRDLRGASAYSYLADGVRTDDGYLLCGIESPGITLGGAGWVVAVSDDGEVEWHRRYPATDRALEDTVRRDTVRAVLETDRGYVLAGDYEPDRDRESSRAWLIGIDDAGEVRWDERFDLGDGIDRVYDLEPTDYGYLAVGATGSRVRPPSGAFVYDHGVEGGGFVAAYDDRGERRWLERVGGAPLYSAATSSRGVVAGGAREGIGWIGTVERTDFEASAPSAVRSLCEAHGGELVAAGRGSTADTYEGWVHRLDSVGDDTERDDDPADSSDDAEDSTEGDSTNDDPTDGEGDDDADATDDRGDDADGGDEGDGQTGDPSWIEFLDCETVRVVGEFDDVILGTVFWDENGVFGNTTEPVGGVDGERTFRASNIYGDAPAGPIVDYAEAFEAGTAVVPGNGDFSATHPDYEDCKSAALSTLEGRDCSDDDGGSTE